MNPFCDRGSQVHQPPNKAKRLLVVGGQIGTTARAIVQRSTLGDQTPFTSINHPWTLPSLQVHGSSAGASMVPKGCDETLRPPCPPPVQNLVTDGKSTAQASLQASASASEWGRHQLASLENCQMASQKSSKGERRHGLVG